MDKMRKINNIKSIVIILLLTSTTLVGVSAEDQYQIKKSITAPTPVKYENFGGGVSINNKLIVIGAPKGTSGGVSNSGIVYVFNLEGEFMYTIESPNPESGAMFGDSITTSDKYIVIGTSETVDSKSEAGRIYVFDLQGNLLQQIQSPSPGREAFFGATSVAIEGDDIIVSDEYTPDSMTIGKTYIFGIDGELKSTFEPPMPMRGTVFGVSPKMSGDYVIITEVVLSQVHIYNINGEHLRTIDSPYLNNGMFGVSTAINDDKIIIGEPWVNRIHIFDFEGNLIQTITPPSGHNGDFGYYVDSDGDLIVVSEYKGDVDDISDAGYVFIYDMSENLLSMIHSPDPQKRGGFSGGQYPRSVLSISGEKIVVGEYHYDHGELTDAGRAHIIERGSFSVTVSDLTLEPSSVEIGDSVTCSVKCSNSGTFSGEFKVNMKINEELKEEKTITLDAGASETVTFTVTGESEGDYLVDINGEQGSFTVKKAQTGILGYPLEAILIGTVVVYLALLISKK
jgi:hypothetical protein